MSRNLDNRFAENRIDFTGHDRRRAVCPAGRSRLPRSAPAASQRRSLAILIKLTAKLSAPPDTVLLRGAMFSPFGGCFAPGQVSKPPLSNQGLELIFMMCSLRSMDKG